MDPVHGYQAVNVEAEQRDPSSFLHWLRRMLAVRHQYPAIRHRVARGPAGRQPSVLAYVRQAHEGDRLGLGSTRSPARPVATTGNAQPVQAPGGTGQPRCCACRT